MEPTDITIEILKDIRTELRDVRTDMRDGLQSVREEIQGVREEIQTRVDRLERRQTEGEIRVSTELVAIAGVMRVVRDELRAERALSVRVDDHERRLTAIEGGKQAQ